VASSAEAVDRISEVIAVARSKRPGRKKTRKAIGQQMRSIRRDLGHIDTLAGQVPLSILPTLLYRYLLVIHELYRQQKAMYERRVHP